MEVKTALMVGIPLAVIVLVLGGKIGSSNISNGSSPGEYDDFAKCLSGNGVRMYGSHLCSHCNNQKALFGASWKFVNYVECATTPAGEAACSGAGIRAYPTWVFGDGTKIEGEQSIKQLGAKSGCNVQ